MPGNATGRENIGDKGVELIKHFEGFEEEAYQDVVGVWTIGYGHTGGVRAGQVLDLDDGERILREDLKKFERAVRRRVLVELNQDQFDALVSWTFNLGEGNLKVSTLLRRLNNGEHDAVPSEMARWNKAGGEVYDGLVRRRRAEGKLWADGALDFS